MNVAQHQAMGLGVGMVGKTVALLWLGRYGCRSRSDWHEDNYSEADYAALVREHSYVFLARKTLRLQAWDRRA
jgi:hypothetical protein